MSPLRFDDKVRTLVVEDQGIFRAFLCEWFRGQDKFEVVGAAASAEEGLRLAQELQPNFLVVDMHLPGMDGLALVRAVRQMRPETRSLILTSLTDPLAVTRIRESGVEGYLEKDCTRRNWRRRCTRRRRDAGIFRRGFATRSGAKAASRWRWGRFYPSASSRCWLMC